MIFEKYYRRKAIFNFAYKIANFVLYDHHQLLKNNTLKSKTEKLVLYDVH